MGEEDCTLETRYEDRAETGGSSTKPTLVIRFDGSSSDLQDRLESPEAGRSYPNELDVAFRIRSHRGDSGTRGVLTISNRLTGEHILELETDAEHISDFVDTVHGYADKTSKEVQYYVDFQSDEGTVWDCENQVLLVRASDGNLLRHRSLIPTWFEI